MISIIIPAYNEEQYIRKCLESIEIARTNYEGRIEIIVVLNRCTDNTEKIASEHGAKLIFNNDKNLSKIRNSGVACATGKIVVTMDADSLMHEKTLVEVEKRLNSGKYIGGGVKIKFEKNNLQTILTYILFALIFFRTWYIRRLSVGLFWCYKKDFDAIKGFDESLVSAEDIDFAYRLKQYGKKLGKKYGTINNTPVTTSNRKFGSWFYFKNLNKLFKIKTGKDQNAANQVYYDYPR